jgi:uncharacterized membrane protein (DUF441 family)
MSVLQLSGVGVWSLLNFVTGGFALVSTLLGVTISYMAYRGLRRHESAPMRYLAVGMMLLFGVTYAVALLGQTLVAVDVVPAYTQQFFRLLVRVLQFGGLACILYSLWLGARTNSTTTERIDAVDD